MSDVNGRQAKWMDAERETGERRPWVEPSVRRMSAGSAEDGKGSSMDRVNFS